MAAEIPSNCDGPATGPIVVASSSGSPTFMASQRASSLSMYASAISGTSSTRLVDVHHWPAQPNPALTVASTAASRSASASTISAFLPPSSSWVRVKSSAAMQPGSCGRPPVDPVNEMARTRGSRTSRLPSALPAPVTQLNTPAGQPGLLEQPGHEDRRPRGEAGRFEDDRVAGQQGRQNLFDNFLLEISYLCTKISCRNCRMFCAG